MERLLLVAVIAALAVAVAVVLQRRQRPSPPTNVGYNVPGRVDRHDFAQPEAPWLVVVFTSATCETCADVWTKTRHLESAGVVAVQEVEASAGHALHDRYRINGVPTTVVVDAAGVVRAGFLGPVTATDLWASVAELRQPGTLPPNSCNFGEQPST
jgi:hypothetical protein